MSAFDRIRDRVTTGGAGKATSEADGSGLGAGFEAGGGLEAATAGKKKKAPLKERSRLTSLTPVWRYPIVGTAGLFSLYVLWTTFVRLNLNIQLSIYLGVTLSLIFLVYQARGASPKTRPSVVDLGLVIMALLPTINFALNFEEMTRRTGIVLTSDIVFGVMISIASLEAARRILGWALPSIAVFMVIYALYGNYFPDLVAHRGMTTDRVISTIYSINGVFGIVTRTFTVFVVVFLVLGAFLQQSGAGNAFINLANSAFGRRQGGAAKAAVVSSGLAGSVLGTGAANIAITGTFTIPLMKKRGYPAHVASAYETVASIGGHVLPPVMGAAAFLMASFIGVPYVDIVVIAVVPALLLYLSLYADVHFFTKRHDIEGRLADDESLPRLRQTLVTDGPLLIPLFVLVGALFLGYSPFRAAVFGVIATLITPQALRLINPRYNFGPRKIWQALVDGSIQNLVVGSSAGVLGILVGMLLLPGTGLSFSSWVVQLSGDSLFVAILFVILASYILGMGMTVTAAYIVIAIVAAPALTEFGVPVIIAHLAIIWFSQDSSFTPPFALGSFIAAGIGDADPMKTAWRSVLVGKPFYIIPFLMIFTPLVGLDGWTMEVYWQIFSSGLGLICTAAVTEQYLARRLRVYESVILLAASLMLFWPSYLISSLGLTIAATMYVLQRLEIRRDSAGNQGTPATPPGRPARA